MFRQKAHCIELNWVSGVHSATDNVAGELNLESAGLCLLAPTVGYIGRARLRSVFQGLHGIKWS